MKHLFQIHLMNLLNLLNHLYLYLLRIPTNHLLLKYQMNL